MFLSIFVDYLAVSELSCTLNNDEQCHLEYDKIYLIKDEISKVIKFYIKL